MERNTLNQQIKFLHNKKFWTLFLHHHCFSLGNKTVSKPHDSRYPLSSSLSPSIPRQNSTKPKKNFQNRKVCVSGEEELKVVESSKTSFLYCLRSTLCSWADKFWRHYIPSLYSTYIYTCISNLDPSYYIHWEKNHEFPFTLSFLVCFLLKLSGTL